MTKCKSEEEARCELTYVANILNRAVLIFASGKSVITGLKSSKQIKPTIQKLENVIKTSK